MKIKYSTALSDVWFGSLIRLTTNLWVIVMLVAGALFLTYSRVSQVISQDYRVGNIVVWIVELFVIHLGILSTAGFFVVAIMLPLMFFRKKGLAGLHELELQEEGLFEVTDVNKSLWSYSAINRPRLIFGLYIVSVGSGFIVFRTKRIIAGEIISFIEELNNRRQS